MNVFFNLYKTELNLNMTNKREPSGEKKILIYLAYRTAEYVIFGAKPSTLGTLVNHPVIAASTAPSEPDRSILSAGNDTVVVALDAPRICSVVRILEGGANINGAGENFGESTLFLFKMAALAERGVKMI